MTYGNGFCKQCGNVFEITDKTTYIKLGKKISLEGQKRMLEILEKSM